jgi:DNA repair protein RadC
MSHSRGGRPEPLPSSADISVTRQFREAAGILDIKILDHVVCGETKADPHRRGFYPFREAGLI